MAFALKRSRRLFSTFSHMDNYDLIQFIKSLFRAKLKQEGPLTLEFFDRRQQEILNTAKAIYPDVADMDDLTLNKLYTTAKNEYASVEPIDINPSGSLVKRKHQSWLTAERKKSMPRDYIDRYLRLLRQSGRPEKVVAEIDRASDDILEKLGDPRSSKGFYYKGLVVGNVQSGKTGNFNAVINKAIDAGYSLIIILSGIMEDLRSQTQERIDNDVVGEGTDKITGRKGEKGVGKIRRFGEQGDTSVAQVVPITSYRSDFNKSMKDSDFLLNNKNILVCKKNTSVLKNLLIWLSDYLQENKDQHNIPLLIIDDEADNASLNNLGYKGRDYASTINGHIRALLNLFSKKAYLGYTATPFANVLQDRNETASGKWPITYRQNGEKFDKEFEQVDNIFPDDFIQLLIPPSNYIGAKHIFETVLDDSIKKLPLLVQVDDTRLQFPQLVIDREDGEVYPAPEPAPDTPPGEESEDAWTRAVIKEDPFPKELPPSLQEAIGCFVISIAIRLSRKPEMISSRLYNPHHTMLIHVSRFITWQSKTKLLTQEYLRTLENRVLNELPGAENSVYKEFARLWNKYFAAIVADFRSYLPDGYKDEFLIPKTWTEIEPLLIEAIKGIEVKAVNSLIKDKLEYTEDTARNGKKYITIGGNRLSRGFTLEGLTINYFIRSTTYSDTLLQMGRWFGYRPGYADCCKLFTTSDAIEKFDATTRTIEELEAEFLKMDREGKTPRDFIIRVKKDPGALKITRPAILRNTTHVNWSYQDKLEQTTKFLLYPTQIEKAYTGFKAFLQKYHGRFEKNNGFYQLHTDPATLFELLALDNSFYNYRNDLSQIRKFIELCIANDKLKSWTIAIKATGNARKIQNLDKEFPFDVQMAQRRGPGVNSAYYNNFINRHIFAVAGKSANIVSAADLAVLLSPEEKAAAEAAFTEQRIVTLVEKKDLDRATAETQIHDDPVTCPERVYRERIPDTQGLLLIYLQDLFFVFGETGGTLPRNEGFNLSIPLIGFAFGFPPIDPDPGGEYVVNKYYVDEEDEEAEEFDNELHSEEL